MGRSKRTIEPLDETFGDAIKKVIRNKNPEEDRSHTKEQDRAEVRESAVDYQRKRSKPRDQ